MGGRLEALTYGLISSIAVDPIEKKPVFHYRPGSRVLSIGQRRVLDALRTLPELADQQRLSGGR